VSTPLFFCEPRYEELARRTREQYAAAEPFPHAVIDDFLPAEVCERLLAEFPSPRADEWLQFKRHHSLKLATRGDTLFGDYTRSVLAHLNGAGCLRFLEALTGIGGLIPDPYFEGGGLHQIERGGYLKIHADFNKQARLNLDRRINLIVYLNKDWREEYNGHLELWDRTMSHCVRKVLPVYNRCVIFNTTDWAYHGHPQQLACPEDTTRKSVALYYYTAGRPPEEQSRKHGTLWQERPATRGFRGAVGTLLRGSATVVEAPGKFLRRLARRVA
jgi:hypothetical protein